MINDIHQSGDIFLMFHQILIGNARRKLCQTVRRIPIRNSGLRGEKISRPRPLNRILVSLRSSFQNFRQAPLPFYMGIPRVGEEGLSFVRSFTSFPSRAAVVLHCTITARSWKRLARAWNMFKALKAPGFSQDSLLLFISRCKVF